MSTDIAITSLLTLIVAIDSLHPHSQAAKPSYSFNHGAIQLFVTADQETRDSDASSSSPVSSTRILANSSFTRKAHRFYNASANDSLHVSVLDEANVIIGRGSASLRLAKKDKLSITIYDLEHRLLGLMHCKLKWDDFDSKASSRIYIVSTLSYLMSFLASVGWVLYSILLILFVAYPFIKNEKAPSYPTSGRFVFQPGMTLYQGDYIYFCKKSSTAAATTCDSAYFHLSNEGTFGLYSGAEPIVSSSTALWQMNPTNIVDTEEETNKTNIFQKLVKNVTKFIKNRISGRGDYRVMLSHEDELILFRGKNLVWRSKLEEIEGLQALL
jgi:hypothetical protein